MEGRLLSWRLVRRRVVLLPQSSCTSVIPEAAGLRHLAFEVDDLAAAVGELDSKGIAHEPIRTDEYTGKQFVFFNDPDGLPIELYEK